MSNAKAPPPGELNRQVQAMEKDLRAYIDTQLDGIAAGGRAERRSYRAAVSSSPLSRGWAGLLILLLVALFAMVAWLGWGISVLSGQVEELGGRVESLTLEVESLRGTEPGAVTQPGGAAQPEAGQPPGVEAQGSGGSASASGEQDAEPGAP